MRTLKPLLILVLLLSTVKTSFGNNQQNIPTVTIRSYNGQLLGWDSPGIITANKTDISDREFFKIFNISRPDQIPTNNDVVVIQCQNGLFLGIRDDGRIGCVNDYFSPKVRFNLILNRTNEKGDFICNFKNISTNKFLMSINGGGFELSNNATLAREFETFTIRFHEPLNVFIRANNNDFLTVNGAGQVVLSRTSTAPQRSSFSFIVLNRSVLRSNYLYSRDTVLIRFRYQFMVLGGDGRSIFATSDRGNNYSKFVISDQALSPAAISTSGTFTVKSVQNNSYWNASDLLLTTSSTGTAPQNVFKYTNRTTFGAESGYPSLPSTIRSFPFSSSITPKTGTDTVVVFKLQLNTGYATNDADISNKLFGAAPSLSTWLRDNSNNRYNVASKGIFGPFRIYDGWSKNNYDTLLTMAENSGLNLNSFGVNVWNQLKYKLLLIEPGGSWGNAGYVTGTSRRGYVFNGFVAAAGVSADIDKASRMVMAHEISHSLFGVTDRYPWRRPNCGDVVAYNNRLTEYASQKFIISKRSGTGPIQAGDQVSLKCGNQWVVTTINAPYFLNIVQPFTEYSWFTINTTDAMSLSHNSKINLKAHNNKYVMALEGGNSSISANADIPREWETFTIKRTNNSIGPIMSGDEILLMTYKEFYVDAFPGGKTKADENSKRRGYTWERNSGGGCGGAFDNSSANYNVVLLNLYDRIRLGWLTPKYLTPDNKGTYLIRPYIGSGDGFVLFDPANPDEWYTLENRVAMPNRDEIPSSGLVISWINENESYWRNIYASNNDNDVSGWRVNYPVVISAAAPRNPPNPFFYPPLLRPNFVTMRNNSDASFCSYYSNHEVVLPLGNGSPSRFHLIINKVSGSNDILLTIK